MTPSLHPVGPDELGDEPEPAEPSGGSTVDWTALPDAVRARVAELGAEAIGALPAVDIPQQLRAVARFTPAKRARLGSAPIIASLRDSTAFR
ncbi:MAG TPA: RNA-binding protein, partial [Actinophytocola sp.]|nr:RNA-binding protein [Actinophytocola sp.]